MYSATGKNFVRTMLTLGRTRDRLTVVADQKGCPDHGCRPGRRHPGDRRPHRVGGLAGPFAGVYHAAGSGWTTWHGLATAAFAEAARHGMRVPDVAPIATADWPTPARRPADSRLDCGKLAATFGVRLPEWRASLGPTVDAILAATG